MSTRGLAEFANSISSGTENPHSGGSCLPWLCARHHLQLLLFGQKAEGYDRFAELLSFPTLGRLPEFAGFFCSKTRSQKEEFCGEFRNGCSHAHRLCARFHWRFCAYV